MTGGLVMTGGLHSIFVVVVVVILKTNDRFSVNVQDHIIKTTSEN